MKKEINRFADEYEFLSNFYPCKLMLDGVTYDNAEAAYQAQKCESPADRTCFSGLGALDSKKKGRSVSLRKDWSEVRIPAMREVLKAKFTQNPRLAQCLLDTDDCHLEEGNYWHDLFWGTDLKTGEGENHLGQLLMELRKELRENGIPDGIPVPEKKIFGPVSGILAEEGDITDSDCECIVNAAGSTLISGSGVVGAIHRAAGPKLREECLQLGGCRVGEAKLTRGYQLKAPYVIHTVGPVYGADHAEEKLSECYKNSLELAERTGIRSIAFPLISAGKSGYPKKEAVRIAVTAVKAWLDAHRETPMEVTFCCVDSEIFGAVCENLRSIAARAERICPAQREKPRQSDWRKIKPAEADLDKIRGGLFGGAAGDALGYPVEFLSENEIRQKYGIGGIRDYALDPLSGLALVSDDTQMSLFTANGILFGDTRGCLRGIQSNPASYVIYAYEDWYFTQTGEKPDDRPFSWLLDIPELHHRRAPGGTCLSVLGSNKAGSVEEPINQSKGCGGIMRVAPLALHYCPQDRGVLDMEGAQIAALTHGHSLGYMPAAVLTHIVNIGVYGGCGLGDTLEDAVRETWKMAMELFSGDQNLPRLLNLLDLAVSFSQNDREDSDNIKELGEGWVAEETLAIAVYCSLRYSHDFSKGIIAAVNHSGDSDSTGAVTGNILGAWLGYDAIEDKWKKNLELREIILEMADDLYHGRHLTEGRVREDPVWISKYVDCRYKH